jgi:hypothetical protein
MLAAVGVSATDIGEERSRMSEIVYGRTKSRSLLGTLNDFSFGARVPFIAARHESLEDIARVLARTPIMPLDGGLPSHATEIVKHAAGADSFVAPPLNDVEEVRRLERPL